MMILQGKNLLENDKYFLEAYFEKVILPLSCSHFMGGKFLFIYTCISFSLKCNIFVVYSAYISHCLKIKMEPYQRAECIKWVFSGESMLSENTYIHHFLASLLHQEFEPYISLVKLLSYDHRARGSGKQVHLCATRFKGQPLACCNKSLLCSSTKLLAQSRNIFRCESSWKLLFLIKA